MIDHPSLVAFRIFFFFRSLALPTAREHAASRILQTMEANSTTTDHETLPMLPSRSPGRYPQKTLVVAVICAFALGAIGASIVPAPQKATTSLTSLTTADKPSSQQTQELVLKNALDCSASVNTCAETDGASAGSCLKDFGFCLHQNDAKGDSPVFHGDGDHPAFGEKGLKGCICDWYDWWFWPCCWQYCEAKGWC